MTNLHFSQSDTWDLRLVSSCSFDGPYSPFGTSVDPDQSVHMQPFKCLQCCLLICKFLYKILWSVNGIIYVERMASQKSSRFQEKFAQVSFLSTSKSGCIAHYFPCTLCLNIWKYQLHSEINSEIPLFTSATTNWLEVWRSSTSNLPELFWLWCLEGSNNGSQYCFAK